MRGKGEGKKIRYSACPAFGKWSAPSIFRFSSFCFFLLLNEKRGSVFYASEGGFRLEWFHVEETKRGSRVFFFLIVFLEWNFYESTLS